MSARPIRKAPHEPIGPEEARRRMVAASACFAVGERVNVYSTCGGYAGKGLVTYPYGLFEAVSDDGAYIASDGDRIDYRYGYIVKMDGKTQNFFVPAHALARDDDKLSYLRLVAANGRMVGAR